MTRLYVISGAPSSGKSKIIQELGNRGYYTVNESATHVMNGQNARNGSIFPWTNPQAFQQLVTENQLEWENTIPQCISDAFLDRSIIDGVAYYKLHKLPIPAALSTIPAKKYHNVFICDPLQLESTDTRQETQYQQSQLDQLLRNTYKELGYDFHSISVLPVKNRVDQILEIIAQSGCPAQTVDNAIMHHSLSNT